MEIDTHGHRLFIYADVLISFKMVQRHIAETVQNVKSSIDEGQFSVKTQIIRVSPLSEKTIKAERVGLKVDWDICNSSILRSFWLKR